MSSTKACMWEVCSSSNWVQNLDNWIDRIIKFIIMIILKGEVEQRKFKNGCLQPRHACGRSAPLATISAEMRYVNKKTWYDYHKHDYDHTQNACLFIMYFSWTPGRIHTHHMMIIYIMRHMIIQSSHDHKRPHPDHHLVENIGIIFGINHRDPTKAWR